MKLGTLNIVSFVELGESGVPQAEGFEPYVADELIGGSTGQRDSLRGSGFYRCLPANGIAGAW